MAVGMKPRSAFWKRSPPAACVSADLPTTKGSIRHAGRSSRRSSTNCFSAGSPAVSRKISSTLLPDDKLEALLTDPEDEKTGMRLRTLADRLGIQEKDFATIKATAGAGLKALILAAASGTRPG